MNEPKRIADALLALADATQAYWEAEYQRGLGDGRNHELAVADWRAEVEAAADALVSNQANVRAALGLLPPPGAAWALAGLALDVRITRRTHAERVAMAKRAQHAGRLAAPAGKDA
jgi:hypothetical protein